jgi:hypothetical protein
VPFAYVSYIRNRFPADLPIAISVDDGGSRPVRFSDFMAPCWGVLWCSNGANTTGAMQHGHRPPHDNPSDPGAIGCECVETSLPPVAFHTQLHNALRHRRCLSKDPLTRNRAQRVSVTWKRTTIDYGLLAYGILEHTRRGPSHIYGHDLHGENATWLEFGVASAGSTNVTCDALQQRFAADRATSTPPRVVGFDTFTGLPEQWGAYMAKGRFSQGGVLPPTQPCATLRKGLINATLPSYLAQQQQQQQQPAAGPPPPPPPPPPLLGVSVDVDLYSASYDALTLLQRQQRLHRSVVHFHELVVPYGPADSNVYHPTEGAANVRAPHSHAAALRQRARRTARAVDSTLFYLMHTR